MGFKKYLKHQDQPGAVYTFGRFNPMHKLHGELWDFVSTYGKKNKMDAIIFTSLSQNAKKNPLTPADKIFYIEKLTKAEVSHDMSLKNAFQILESLIEKGYKRITFVVGGDRTSDFQSLKKYANEWGKGTVDFKIETFSARVKGYSGTLMREYVKYNDFNKFFDSLPKGLNKKEALELFNKVQVGLEK